MSPEGLTKQQKVLEEVSSTYRRNSSQDSWMRRLCVTAIRPWLKSTDSVLEVGCSDGMMTEMLSAIVDKVSVVEASSQFVALVQSRALHNVEIRHCMVEEYAPTQKFDKILVTWVLTHILDAEMLLKTMHNWLAPGGLVFVAVPNARVLSRQLAMQMGLIDDLYTLTENDRNHGHVRAYDRPALRAQLNRAGFESIFECGLMMKPLADFQMDQLYGNGTLSEKHVEGLYRLGLEYPELASALLSVCRVAIDE